MPQRPNAQAAVLAAISRFEGWLSHARRGDTFTYHVGLLSADRCEILYSPTDGTPTLRPVEPFDSLGRHVWNAARAGKVSLWQRREGPAEYHYLARKTCS